MESIYSRKDNDMKDFEKKIKNKAMELKYSKMENAMKASFSKANLMGKVKRYLLMAKLTKVNEEMEGSMDLELCITLTEQDLKGNFLKVEGLEMELVIIKMEPSNKDTENMVRFKGMELKLL